MIPQFTHKLISSFQLWFENKLVSDGCKAYFTNVSNTFRQIDFDDIPSGYYAYQGLHRQLVAEYDVDVPNSGVIINGNFVSGDSEDIYIDYNRGRVVVPEASGDSLNITANHTIKEVNVYLTEDDETQILTQSDFIDTSDTSTTHLSSKVDKLDDNIRLLPACFIKLEKNTCEPLAFGGYSDTPTSVRVIVLASSNYIVDGLLSFFTEQCQKCIPLVPFGDNPYGEIFTLKSYPYAYSDYTGGYGEKAFISKVRTSKVTDSFSLERLQRNLVLGYIDFELSTYRYPNM